MEDYTILGRIGEGAHGIVMKARHRKTGTIVALKKVLLKVSKSQKQFFLKLHCQKNERNIRQNSVL